MPSDLSRHRKKRLPIPLHLYIERGVGAEEQKLIEGHQVCEVRDSGPAKYLERVGERLRADSSVAEQLAAEADDQRFLLAKALEVSAELDNVDDRLLQALMPVRSCMSARLRPCACRSFLRTRKASRNSAVTACRVAPGDHSPEALSRSGLGDFHHPAPPLMRLVAKSPRSARGSEAWAEGSASR